MSGFKTLVMGSGASGTDTTPDASIVTLKAADYATFKAGTITADKYDTIKLAAATEETEVNVSGVSALVDVSGLTNLKTLTTDKDSYVAVTAAQFGGEKIGATTLGTLKLTDALTEESGAISGAWTAAIELAAGTANSISITPDAGGVYTITGDGSGDVVEIKTTEDSRTIAGLSLKNVTLNISGDNNLIVSGDVTISGQGNVEPRIVLKGGDSTADLSNFKSDIGLQVSQSNTAAGTLLAGEGNDTLQGLYHSASSAGSLLVGGTGADYFLGGGTVVTGAFAEGDSATTSVATLKESTDIITESGEMGMDLLVPDGHQVIVDSVYNVAFKSANGVCAFNYKGLLSNDIASPTMNVVGSTAKDSIIVMSGNEVNGSGYMKPVEKVNLYHFDPTDVDSGTSGVQQEDNIVLINHSKDLAIGSVSDATPIALLMYGDGKAAVSGFSEGNKTFKLGLTNGALDMDGQTVTVTWAGIANALTGKKVTAEEGDLTDAQTAQNNLLDALSTAWTGAGTNGDATSAQATTEFSFNSLSEGSVNLAGVYLEFYVDGSFEVLDGE